MTTQANRVRVVRTIVRPRIRVAPVPPRDEAWERLGRKYFLSRQAFAAHRGAPELGGYHRRILERLQTWLEGTRRVG
jgi:hypothetical protein